MLLDCNKEGLQVVACTGCGLYSACEAYRKSFYRDASLGVKKQY